MIFSSRKVLFYEKVGCAGNARQKQLLKNNNIEFETVDILNHYWTRKKLLCFFKDATKEEMLNPFAPSIKNNLIDIKTYTKDELIELMIKEPIMIKRPLIAYGDNYLYGFDLEKINNLLKSNMSSDIALDTCQLVGNSCE